ERRSLRQAEQVAILASETAVSGSQTQRRSARRGRGPAPRNLVELQEPWREDHGAAAREPRRSTQTRAILIRRAVPFVEVFAPTSRRPELPRLNPVVLAR